MNPPKKVATLLQRGDPSRQISQGETLEEAKANLREALQLVLECQRELAEKNFARGCS